MTTFSVRVPEDVARRFDAGAALAGGRSARLRQLIAAAAGGVGAPPDWIERDPAPVRLMVRLGPREAGHVAVQACALSMPRAAWVSALVRRHALGEPTFPRREELGVLAIQAEVRRIGVNVNQIARALNTAVLEGRVLQLELAELGDLQRELRAHIQALKAAFEGNLAYWETP